MKSFPLACAGLACALMLGTSPCEAIDMIKVTGGSFTMGTPESETWRDADETAHQETVSDFYIAPYEVSQSLYEEVMGNNPSRFKGADLPVESVTWYEALFFCNKLSEKEGLTPVYGRRGGVVTVNNAADGYRLPTEAEWEYACRAGSSTPYNIAATPSPDEANYYGHYPYNIETNYFTPEKLAVQPGGYHNSTVAVNSYSPNAQGLYNMHGNVAEWVFDVYDPYGQNLTDGYFRVYRGGAWNDFAKHLRSGYRGVLKPGQRLMTVGFRVARNAAAGEGTRTISETPANQIGGKKLVVFYSFSGNTRRAAKIIADKTGADIVELAMKDPYTDDYTTVLKESADALFINDLPALSNAPDLSRYDTILIGYPLWWASVPRPIASLIEGVDFKDKTIVPFSSNGGGHLGQSVTYLMKNARNADFGTALEIHYSGGSSLEADIDTWLSANGLR